MKSHSNRVQVQIRIRNIPTWKPKIKSFFSKSAHSLSNASFKDILCMDVPCPNVISISDPDPVRNRSEKQFTFDKVFGPENSQEDVYNDAAKRLIDKCLEGYNGCIFSYGQTASGKTYTMQGPNSLTFNNRDRGLIYRAIEHITTHIKTSSKKSMIEPVSGERMILEYSVKASYLEIYQESLRDLLCADVAQGNNCS
jgi:hypothetical protein